MFVSAESFIEDIVFFSVFPRVTANIYILLIIHLIDGCLLELLAEPIIWLLVVILIFLHGSIHLPTVAS